MPDGMTVAAEETALAVIRSQLPTILQADKDDILGQLAAKIAAHKPDPTTNRGREEIRSLAAECRRTKADLDRLGKGLTEEWRKSTAAVNAERKVIEDRLDALAIQVRAPLTEFENREKQRVAAHEAAIAEIEAWATVPADWSAAQIAARIAELQGHPHLARDWQEFKDRAGIAARNSYNAMRVAESDAIAQEHREAEAAEEKRRADEAGALRLAQEQRAREERAAAEAKRVAEAEGERKLAEAAQAAQREREAAAERERVVAEALAREQRERQEAEERAQQLAREAEANRVAQHRRALAAIAPPPGYGEVETSIELALRMDHLTKLFDGRAWEEFAREADDAIHAEIERTRKLLATARAREAAEAAREAEAQRQETARREAAAAEAAREAERRRVAADQKREAEAQEARERNRAHRAKINREARDAIVPVIADIHTGSAEQSAAIAQAVVEALARKAVPHCVISY